MKEVEVKVDDLNRDYVYISDGTWYDKGTICILEINCCNSCLMIGMKDGKLDGEMCGWDEFDIYDFKNNKIKPIYSDEYMKLNGLG